MKRRIIYMSCSFLLMMCMAGVCVADEMALEGPSSVQSGFDGEPLEIPVSLSGDDAVLQLVIVEDMDWDIPPWAQDVTLTVEGRFAEGLEPLVFVGQQVAMQSGDGVVTWTGQDMDGVIPPVRWYRYYVLAFEPGSAPESPDYGPYVRGEILENVSAMASGVITGYDIQPIYPLMHFTVFTETEAYATVELDSDFNGTMEAPFTDGDEIGVFSPRGDLVGAYIQYPRIIFGPGMFRIYGDDPATSEIDGMQEGEPLRFVVWDYQTGTEYSMTATFSVVDPVYEEGAIYTLESLEIGDPVFVADIPPIPFTLFQNSPNPANPSTTISFVLPDDGNVSLEIYNLAGQKIDTLFAGNLDAGNHSMVWDGSGCSSGIYFYTLRAGEFTESRKMMLMK